MNPSGDTGLDGHLVVCPEGVGAGMGWRVVGKGCLVDGYARTLPEVHRNWEELVIILKFHLLGFNLGR